jgi:hypothetical protein
MQNPRPCITYTANRYGYEVFVTRRNHVIDNYTAGNCAHDSVEVVPLHDPSCLKLSDIKKLALRTAREFAVEYNVSRHLIQFHN